MYSVLKSYGLNGLNGFAVAVEADVSGGLPAFSLVGLPDSAVRESGDRVRSAVKNLGYKWPDRHITVNLAPADIRKSGPVYDLPLLLAVLASSGQMEEPPADAAFLGELALDGSLLLQYRARISRGMFLATGSYLVLPLLAISIQIVHYGLALVDLAIGVAMVLMFLVSIKEQNEEMLRLETSRAHLAEKLDIATVLNRCVEKLSGGGHDLDKATHDLLGVINDYFCADRSYVYELNAANGIAVNTHEFVRDGVSAEKDNLQKVPVEIIASWLEAFERDGIYFMEDVGQVKGTELYAMMQQQNVQRLLAVPLRRETRIIGFLGVDNPREHSHDPTLLSSLQFFVTNSLEQKKVQEKLYRLSYRDTLTGLDNRNRYMELLEAGKENALKQVGGIYMDLNGLKRCNDCFGHAAGDALICRAADALNDVFPGEACRIGGDEFVVICCPVTQEKFEQQVEALRAALVRHQVDAAIGSFWQSLVEDLPAFLREADDRMYREKERQKRAARPSV